MPSLLRTGRAPVRRVPGGARTLLLLAVLALILLSTVAALQAQHLSRRWGQVGHDLGVVVTEIYTQDALSTNASAGSDVGSELARSRGQVLIALRDAAAVAGPDAALGDVRAGYRAYVLAVDRRLALLQAGRGAEVAAVDREQVRPAYNSLQQALAERVVDRATAAAHAGALGDVALGLTMLLGLAFTVVLSAGRPHDGLPNRARFVERLGHARSSERPGRHTGLLLIDLDRFKEVNDTLGHQYGDRLLARIGPRLAEGLRRTDTVARLGGDEFAVLLPGLEGLDDALAVARTLQAALSEPFWVDNVQLDVEASIGVVISGRDGDDAGTLMQRADIAMYAAKQGRLGVSTYDREVDPNTPERLALLGDLRRALTEGELFLHFQPQVDVRTGRLCSAEALLRWQHPRRGLIPPDDFIPQAENTALIGPLTERVLDLALTRMRVWADQGLPLPVAVNLSARNLQDPGLEQAVRDLLERHGVEPHLLRLEVTETAIMADPDRATDLLERLVARGMSVSIDDFGAGYKSIGRLKDLPVAELKVDRSFVTDIEDDDNAVIVRSVIELGHNLGLSVVAEGVETRAALDRLVSYGCDVAQGYLFARPMPAAAFDDWRAGWTGLPAVLNSPLPAPRGPARPPTTTDAMKPPR